MNNDQTETTAAESNGQRCGEYKRRGPDEVMS